MLADIARYGQIQSAAWSRAKDIFQRTENSENLPADLADNHSRFKLTEAGYRIAGMFQPSDLGRGPISPAILLFSFLFPMAWLIYYYSLFSSSSLGWLGLILALGFFSLMIRFGAYESRAPRWLKRTFIFGLVVFTLFMKGWIAVRGLGQMFVSHGFAFGVAFLLSFSPLLAVRRQEKNRAQDLLLQSLIFNESSIHSHLYDISATARKRQAEQAIKDETPFINLGRASGLFGSAHGDDYGPDAGLPVGLTQKDASTHLLTLGRTGTGKTSGILRPFARQWIQHNCGGILVLDGKGELPAEFVGLEGYTLIAPGSAQLALIDGLIAEDVVEVLANLSGNEKEDKFWKASGETLLRNAAVLLEFSPLRIDEPQEYGWTIAGISKVINDPAYRGKLVLAYRDIADEHAQGSFILSSLAYFSDVFPSMPENTAGSIIQTVNSWLAPLLGHRDLLAWASCSKGNVDPADVLEGAKMGVLCPPYMYGAAGPAVSALIKARIYRAIRRRGSEWAMLEGQKQVLMLIDESQEVLGKTDADMLPVARSLGLVVVAGTQSVEAIEARLGSEAKAAAFLTNFRSWACYAASDKTIQWISAQLSKALRPEYKAFGIDFDRSWKLIHQSQFDAMKKEGAGWFLDSGQTGAKKLGENRDGKGMVEGFDKAASQHQLGWGVAPFELKEKMLLEPHEAALYLSVPFNAVIAINRAGVPRRDIVQTAPIFV